LLQSIGYWRSCYRAFSSDITLLVTFERVESVSTIDHSESSIERRFVAHYDVTKDVTSRS
jgi:hypothetical protein